MSPEGGAVTAKDDGLAIKRLPDGSSRGLHHLGDRVFHPAGAPAVRIAFMGGSDRAATVRIDDGSRIVEARRLSDPAGR